MLAFLRKARKSLTQSAPTRKYVVYAIGETLLVVIGILIALQVNNWNEERKRAILERNLLLELKDNLTHDLSDIRFNIDSDMGTMRQNVNVLSQLEQRLPFHDSLISSYGRLTMSTVLVKNVSAYENLQSIGFDLISNDSLRRKITVLYSARYDYLDDLTIQGSNRFIMDHFTPLTIRHLESSEALVAARPINQEALYDNHEFKETIRYHIFVKSMIINVNKSLEDDILEILDLIEKELNI